ncbi:hypothetical protein ACFRJ8_14840 [Arthrobacter sp. NPDC056886]|uniref:hypothetical protein n=1 Tax=Arthrobacter sp. NPDC056886 TaxID=3345960 RepID=UPI00366D32C2
MSDYKHLISQAGGDGDGDVLDQIQRRADKATAGPWKLWGMDVMSDPVGNSDLDDALLIANTADPDRGLRTWNANFIAHARADVPYLLALVREQAAKLEAVGKVADDLAIDSFHETACKPDSADVKLEAASHIRAALEPKP